MTVSMPVDKARKAREISKGSLVHKDRQNVNMVKEQIMSSSQKAGNNPGRRSCVDKECNDRINAKRARLKHQETLPKSMYTGGCQNGDEDGEEKIRTELMGTSDGMDLKLCQYGGPQQINPSQGPASIKELGLDRQISTKEVADMQNEQQSKLLSLTGGSDKMSPPTEVPIPNKMREGVEHHEQDTDSIERGVELQEEDKDGKWDMEQTEKESCMDSVPEQEIEKNDEAPGQLMETDEGAPELQMEKDDGAPEQQTEKDDGAPELQMEKDDGAPELQMEKDDGAPELQMEKDDGAPELQMVKNDEPEQPIVKNDGAPELPMEKDDGAPDLPMEKDEGAPELQMVKNGDPEQPMVKNDEPEQPMVKNDEPEQPMEKDDRAPELPMEKDDEAPELPKEKDDGAPELQMMKNDGAPELPMEKDDGAPELPMEKDDGAPELQMVKNDREREQPIEKENCMDTSPELTITKDEIGSVEPELPIEEGDTSSELPISEDGTEMPRRKVNRHDREPLPMEKSLEIMAGTKSKRTRYRKTQVKWDNGNLALNKLLRNKPPMNKLRGDTLPRNKLSRNPVKRLMKMKVEDIKSSEHVHVSCLLDQRKSWANPPVGKNKRKSGKNLQRRRGSNVRMMGVYPQNDDNNNKSGSSRFHEWLPGFVWLDVRSKVSKGRQSSQGHVSGGAGGGGFHGNGRGSERSDRSPGTPRKRQHDGGRSDDREDDGSDDDDRGRNRNNASNTAPDSSAAGGLPEDMRMVNLSPKWFRKKPKAQPGGAIPEVIPHPSPGTRRHLQDSSAACGLPEDMRMVNLSPKWFRKKPKAQPGGAIPEVIPHPSPGTRRHPQDNSPASSSPVLDIHEADRPPVPRYTQAAQESSYSRETEAPGFGPSFVQFRDIHGYFPALQSLRGQDLATQPPHIEGVQNAPTGGNGGVIPHMQEVSYDRARDIPGYGPIHQTYIDIHGQF